MAVDAARAKSLFLAASDLADPAERAAYLDRECGGDAELRARVEALLRANDAAPLPVAPGAAGGAASLARSSASTRARSSASPPHSRSRKAARSAGSARSDAARKRDFARAASTAMVHLRDGLCSQCPILGKSVSRSQGNHESTKVRKHEEICE